MNSKPLKALDPSLGAFRKTLAGTFPVASPSEAELTEPPYRGGPCHSGSDAYSELLAFRSHA